MLAPKPTIDPTPNNCMTLFIILLWAFISLTAPPLITSCVFKDDVDEGATYQEKNVRWNNNLEHFEKVEEHRIHDTNHDGFSEDDLKRTLHLLHVAKKTQAIVYDHDDSYFRWSIPPGCCGSLVFFD